MTGGECWVGGEYLNDKCSIEVKCEQGNKLTYASTKVEDNNNSGYYPEDPLILYGDNLKMKCDESSDDKWIQVKEDPNSPNITLPIKCIKGCIDIDPKVKQSSL